MSYTSQTSKDMKTYVQMILSSMIGGFVVGVLIITFQPEFKNTEHLQSAKFTNYSAQNLNSSNDFVESASKSTSSVVHIFAEESEAQVMQRRNQQRRDPFYDFFGFDNFFGGGNFYRPKNGTGSGVIYSDDGIIITNNHVVGFADKITITDHKGKKYQANKVGVDEATDIAVLKVVGGKGFLPIKMGDSEKVKVGEWVLAVGNPFGYLTSTVTAGIVSAKGRSLGIIQNDRAIEEFIQTDAAINPGNSGGALVNLNGELVGINTAIATPTGVFAGYSFAIPSKLVKEVVKEILEKGGNIEPTSLGVVGYDVTKDLAIELDLKGLSNYQGFYVAEVTHKSAAQLGGIIPGDVILGINDKIVKNYNDIVQILKYNKPGDKLKIKVNRDGKERLLEVFLRKAF